VKEGRGGMRSVPVDREHGLFFMRVVSHSSYARGKRGKRRGMKEIRRQE